MIDILQKFSSLLTRRARQFSAHVPSASTLYELVRLVYFATLETEEGLFPKASVTFANPRKPDEPPRTQRADYPLFTSFGESKPLSVGGLVKLARAVDKWSGSIAVWGTSPKNLVAWGIVDQLVGTNVRLHHEAQHGFSYPGTITIAMDGVGRLSAYHGDIFLGGLNADSIMTSQNDPLRSKLVLDRVAPSFSLVAACIAKAVGIEGDSAAIHKRCLESWSGVVSRLCIGLRRMGTGGSFLISPNPITKELSVPTQFRYARLGDSLALRVLDDEYRNMLLSRRFKGARAVALPPSYWTEMRLAEADAKDRERELAGAVKLVTSLAAVDGLVLMTPSLQVLGFGVKIEPGPTILTVYDARGYIRRGRGTRRFDISVLGTRHTSLLRYCRRDPRAIGIVVSQDGTVRMMISSGRSLVLWDDIKLMAYVDFSQSVVLGERRTRARRARAASHRRQLGYTETPKTMRELLAVRRGEGRQQSP